MWLVLLIPKKLLSRLVGFLAALERPRFLVQLAIAWYMRRFRIDLTEVASPIESFSSLAAFFIRDLVPNARPIGGGVVSPCDGALRSSQPIVQGTIEQVKGIEYSLASLTGVPGIETSLRNGNALSLYLSPRDYHHVHVPYEGVLTRVRWIPGTLWPVNDWALQNVPQLFAVNERVVFELLTSAGTLYLVMVGALNVGKISSVHVPDLAERFRGEKEGEVVFESPSSLRKGERLGTFHMGSSVVLLLPMGLANGPFRATGSIRMGESLTTE